MTSRNPARDMHDVEYVYDSDDPEPSHYVRVSTKSKHSKIPTPKPHLVTTDFSIDTLARYLKEEFEKQKYEEEAQNNDPNLAAVDAKIESIRQLVNGNKLIEIDIRSGQIWQRDNGPLLDRDFRVYRSIGLDLNMSNELEPMTLADNRAITLGKMKEQSNQNHNCGPPRSDMPWPMTLEDLARALSYKTPDAENPNLDEMFDFFIGSPNNVPLTAAYKFRSLALMATLAPKAYADQEWLAMDSSDSSVEASSPSDDRDNNGLFGPSIKSQSVEVPAADSSSDIEKDTSDTLTSSNTASLTQHSHSFMKHSAEARQLTRGRVKAKNKVWTESGESSSSTSDSSLPRKSPSSKSVSTLQAKNALAAQGSDTSRIIDRSLVSASQDQPVVDSSEELIVDEDTGFAYRFISKGREYGPSQLLLSFFNTAFVKEPRSLTGIDTLGSVFSNNFASCSDNDDGITEYQVERNENKAGHSELETADERAKDAVVTVFDYNSIVPEKLPLDIVLARENCRRVWLMNGLDNNGKPDIMRKKLWYGAPFSMQELDPDGQNILAAANKYGYYPRRWEASDRPASPNSPPICPATTRLDEFPPSVLPEICRYLSTQEIRNLRLVNRATSIAVMPLMIRSTVIEFGPRLFTSIDGKDWDPKSNSPAPTSLLQNWGPGINRFGISFEWDSAGLANAQHKTIEEEVQAWFGPYIWPTVTYPRFQQLKDLEELVDGNRSLLKNTMRSLVGVTELALSVDSGHGWLNGPDMSDMAMLRKNLANGSKVFGKNYDAADISREFALREYFEWAQLNTINAFAKAVASLDETSVRRMHKKFIQKIRVRPYDTYRIQSIQPDFTRTSHVGGHPLSQAPAPAPAPLSLFPLVGFPVHWNTANGQPTATSVVSATNTAGSTLIAATGLNAANNAQNINATSSSNSGPANASGAAAGSNTANHTTGSTNAIAQRFIIRPHIPTGYRRNLAAIKGVPVNPQWPLIFSCMNLAGQVGGNQDCIQEEVAHPGAYPYMPGELTETHVQWLMETLWAQRAFMIAYTNSIITNVGVFEKVHTLNFAKLSSSLIQFLSQKEFWAALPGLKKLILKVIPDWRQEHVPGDKSFHSNMPISPVQASIALAELLKNTIANIEHLSTLTVGFVGGGEHQTGMYARNRHVLPAPITCDPDSWVHQPMPDQSTMIVFNHIRDLTFENCWFTPKMLEVFMNKSRDTSLHHLTLDSVSLTGIHDRRGDGAYNIAVPVPILGCKHDPCEWLHEEIPHNACWINCLEKVVPGQTIMDRKFEAGLINPEEFPHQERSFRGNIKKITLKSCGYVKISGTRSNLFSQRTLVEQSQPNCAVDEGLVVRKNTFGVTNHRQPPTESLWFRRRYGSDGAANNYSSECVMMSERNPINKNEYFGLGKLTQCVHPIEKRLLEHAWDMRFGWGDDMERWAAVEDGWYEGGTGRFSGTIE